MHKLVWPYLLFILFFFHGNSSLSQELNPPSFGKVTANDFMLPQSNLIDSATRAVIIGDVGSIGFIGNKDNNWVSYVFHQKMRIKLLKKQAFDLATISILLHGRDKRADILDSLQASTYTLENGKVTEQKLDLKDVYRDTLTKYTVKAKFTLPGLQEGCIIEYSYKVTSIRPR